ncbi:hypothetical protein GN244_ATG17455 [Phytophthora infestans]|uniref:Uncharacterized protein n=1 Tax=Phytophthora infestans TaxID=4787 RepID=A0A833SHC0_PHYIN|nr:hypothetical protein GN244_ATG17455 [Phytophthora infestans]KAF4142600.1 hypothetical protein GN958_ATG08201 [Phytophthora infestans]
MARKRSATPPRSHHFELRSRRLSRTATTVGDAPSPQVGIAARARPVDPILLIMWHLNILRLSVDAVSHLDVANNVPPHWMSAQPPNIIMTTFTHDLCYNLRATFCKRRQHGFHKTNRTNRTKESLHCMSFGRTDVK